MHNRDNNDNVNRDDNDNVNRDDNDNVNRDDNVFDSRSLFSVYLDDLR